MLNLRLLLTFLFAFMLVHGVGQQKHEWKEASSGPFKYRYVTNDPIKARFYTLKNGLTVILSRNNKEPRIQTLIGVRAGSNNDPKEHTGLAHYLEHLLFKGTYQFGSLDSAKEKTYIAQIEQLYDEYNNTKDAAQRKSIYKEIDSVSAIAAKYAIPGEYGKMLTSMGAQNTNAHTSVEETVYQENIPSNAIDKFLAVQSERFRNPVFRLFHTELEAVYEEKNRSLDNDGTKVWDTLLANLFPNHNYGQQSTIGTIEHLKNPSLKAIRDFYNKYYVPGNMSLVFAGDFDPDELIKKVDKAFSYMKPANAPEYDGPKEAPITAPVVKDVVGPDAEYVQIGFRMPGIHDFKSAVTMTVVDELLSNGKAGLMDNNLNKQQKVLSSGSSVYFWKDYSLFILTGKAKDGQSLNELKDLLLSQVELLKKGEFDETLVKAIVSNYKLFELQGNESNENRATSLNNAFIQHQGLAWDKEVSAIDEMSKIKKKDVMDFVNKHLVNSHVTVFKKKGQNKPAEKVEKPTITSLALNSDAQSPFVKYVESIPATEIKPQWIDYEKQIAKSTIGPAPVLYVQNKDNDLFRLHYRLETGNYHNRKLGLAAGYLQYLGDGKNSAEEISRQFYNIACSFTINPATEYTTITISGLQENFEKAVGLFENLVLNCQPDEKALENLKARTLKARSDAKLNKNSISRGLTTYAVYGPKNPFNYVLSADELNAVTAKELTDLLHQLFSYKHSIIYYGPKPLNIIVSTVSKLHKVPATLKTAGEPIKFIKKENDKSRVLFAPYEMVQSDITWISNSMPFDSSRLGIIEVFNNYFGGDMGSVVFQTIRGAKALAYSTYAYYAPPDKKEGKYTTVAYVGSQADKMSEAIAAMNELIQDLPKAEQSLRSAKESIRNNLASERITQDAIIFTYLAGKRLGLNTDYRKDIYEKVNNITFEDIKNFHASTIAGNKYTYCVIGAKDKIDMEALKKIGEVKELTLQEIFGY